VTKGLNLQRAAHHYFVLLEELNNDGRAGADADLSEKSAFRPDAHAKIDRVERGTR